MLLTRPKIFRLQKRFSTLGRRSALAALFVFMALLASPCRPLAAEMPIHHRLEVELIPSAHRLSVRDEARIELDDRAELIFSLSDRARQLRVDSGGRPRSFAFKNGELTIRVEPEERLHPLELSIAYEAVFDDPVPDNPLNTDNPGFGVTATVSEAGTFLLAGAGWYPDLADGRETFGLTVKAPPGMIAVTAGRSLGHDHQDGFTWSRWRIDKPVRGLSLSAAAYTVTERVVDGVVAATYFLKDNQDLAADYLEATARYLKLYTERFGPYPFSKFAVVENFFPTGYGFPSYTLLGSTVIRLPFIIDTSLGHEIAHCWWGNGVLVDYEFGNWSEGLTTYVADYLYKEMASETGARDYRLQALRSYAALVPPEKDFPLSRFTARTDPVTKAIGYDKGFMVFHMLRRAVGDDAFWAALRDIQRERLFRKASWFDFKAAFAGRSGLPLDEFFEQWVFQAGAPRLRLDAVRAEPADQAWVVSGRLAQDEPVYSLRVDLAAESGAGVAAGEVAIDAATSPFRLTSPAEPLRLTADPGVHVFRRLEPSEIPPTVNSLKGAPSVMIVVSETLGEKGRRLADIFALSLGLKNRAVVSEAELKRSPVEGRDVLFIGYPARPVLPPEGLEELRPQSGGFLFKGRPFDGRTSGFFGVFEQSAGSGRVLALFLPPGGPSAEAVAAKVTHYGRFSYLVFDQGQNRAKGVWTPKRSPLVHRFQGR